MGDYLLRSRWNHKTGKVELEAASGHYEVDGSDCFFLRAGELEQLPPAWAKRARVEGDFLRVEWPEPARGGWAARLAHHEKEFSEWDVDPLEADVDPARRWLFDHPTARIAKAGQWRLWWYDLETEKVGDFGAPWRSRILSCSWRSSDGRRGHERLAAKTDEAERDLLRRLRGVLAEHDVALAWNGDRFDHPVLRGRGEILGVPIEEELVHWLDHLWIFKRNFIRGDDGGAKQSMSLEAISAAVLGVERKVPVEERARAQGWDGTGDLFTWTWANAPGLLEEYNDQDVRLMGLLEEKTGFVALHLSVCDMCRIFPDRGSQFPSAMIDGRMFVVGGEVGYHFPTKPRIDEGVEVKRARGAYVPAATKGYFENAGVVDYARMYPSIIRAFNMSLETLRLGCGDWREKGAALTRVPRTSEAGVVLDDTIAWYDSTVEGIVPRALRLVIEERKKYSKLVELAEVGSPAWTDAKRLSNACKVLANTFYGVLLSPYSRFYRTEIGESVTSIGRLLLARTEAEVKKLGCQVVFGDTDSVAFCAPPDVVSAFRDRMNAEVIPSIVREYGAKQGEIRIEYDKHFRTLVNVASKKYAGRFLISGGKEAKPDAPIDVRGLEIVRSDVTPAARRLQRATVEAILDGVGPREIWQRLVEVREKFLEGATPVADLIMRKAITRQLEEYATKPPQVQVAERMIERGEEVYVGQKIAFFWEVRGPIAPTEIEGEPKLDLGLYWNKYVWPPTYRVVAAVWPDQEWRALEVARGFDPNQLEIFDAKPAAPPTRRSKPRAIEVPLASPSVPVRRSKPREVQPSAPTSPSVRRSKPRPILVIVVPDGDLAKLDRLKDLVELYPGQHRLEVEVEVSEPRAVVALRAPQGVDDPSARADMATAIRALGWRWNIRRG